MKGTVKYTIKTYPKCDDYLRIRRNGEEYKKIEDFASAYSDIEEPELELCMVSYRGTEKTYKEFVNDYSVFADKLSFVEFDPCRIIVNRSIRASKYFIEKTIDCLQTARFFAMKSKLILDTNYNLPWSQGYVPQYLFRCIYFGTAVTWYSNTFDQLLQAVYWAFELYTDAVDRDKNPYNESWDVKKIMTFCTYEFVVRTLKSREYQDIRKLLTSCSRKIEEIRSWANYIKHKGGIDYKDSEAEDPFQFYVAPADSDITAEQLDDRFAIKNFRSPIEIDIDEKSNVILQAHSALYECITKIINAIDYDKYTLRFGGTN